MASNNPPTKHTTTLGILRSLDTYQVSLGEELFVDQLLKGNNLITFYKWHLSTKAHSHRGKLKPDISVTLRAAYCP